MLGARRREFQSNPTLGQEYRPDDAQRVLSVLRCFNPTRPSARNIADTCKAPAPGKDCFNPTRPSARNIARVRPGGAVCVRRFNPTRPSARNIAPLMRLHPSASKTFQSNPTLGQEYRHAVASNARGIGPFQSNPTLGQEYRCKPRVGLRPHKSFNPTRPSARNIAPLPGSRCFWPLVSIQPDPRPGISRYPVLLLTSTSNPFQSNPTLGQEYRPAARATCPYPCPCFNPTRPSARNIAP